MIKAPFYVETKEHSQQMKKLNRAGYLPSQYLNASGQNWWLWAYVGRERRLLSPTERKIHGLDKL